MTHAYGLVEFGHLHDGDQLLITAAPSSVGLAAIQIANALGAKSIATTRNSAKGKALRDAGAHQVVNTGSDEWIEHVREITVGKGVDLAFDPVAGPVSTRSLRSFARKELFLSTTHSLPSRHRCRCSLLWTRT